MKYDAIIVAAGKGSRAKLGFNKVLFKMRNGKTVIENVCDTFLKDKDCEKVILVTSDEIRSNNKRLTVVAGGEERYHSVMNGLNEVESEYVLIHDGARPFLNVEALEELKKKVEETGAAILGRKATDTIKIINNDRIINTVDRDIIFLAETPQGFKTSIIKECYGKWDGRKFTDDSSLLESYGYTVSIVNDRFDNKKLTDKEDFENI
ncbi:MAG: 2-C-methyl-D-erythritol 4-phosphate cytidylyltransferase [Erysipelotrichaceae bacterium]|nr:2-C-methyl-D-erythritol 4-phosphate cytidylyltransferase [Erysipelotrichaceae bacterium]